MVRPTMMKTITVVSQVSFQLGQVTLLISRRTSWKNCIGETRRRTTGGSASSTVFLITSAISTLFFKLGRGGGTRTHGPRFWRPMLYQLSYTPRKTVMARQQSRDESPGCSACGPPSLHCQILHSQLFKLDPLPSV